MIEAIENFNLGPHMDHCPSPSFTTNSNRSSTYSTFSLGSLKGRFSHIASLFERSETDSQREQQEIPQHPSLSPSHALRVRKNALPFSQRMRLQQNKMQRRDRIAKKTYDFFFFNNLFKRSVACKEVEPVPPAKPKRSSFLFTKHEEPSTLDFCCIGTGGEDDGESRDHDYIDSVMNLAFEGMASDSLGIWGGVQKRHEGDAAYVLSDCKALLSLLLTKSFKIIKNLFANCSLFWIITGAPTIDWVQPRISLEWTDEFSHFS